MPNSLKPLLTIAVAICFISNTYAQTDTSTTDLDLGRIKLNKDFTQSITIKGEQLEKMPFTNLSEAINAWTYGIYASRSNINYVVDGIIINDVNAWSVYDIKEVTLVQNALIQINGANRQQLLVLVTTRKGGTGKQGITVAGQSFLVKTDAVPSPVNSSTSSETNFFHQYQVSAWRNDKNIQYGISANYLRDVNPPLKQPGRKYTVPENYDRFRLNAWFSAKLGTAHDLSVRINAAPQVADMDQTITNSAGGGTVTIQNKLHNKRITFNPTIALRSRLAEGFTNEFTASYAYSRIKGTQENPILYTNPANEYYQESTTTDKMQQVLLMDQISYHASLDNNWHIAPSVNFMFRYIKGDYKYTSMSYNNGNVTTLNLFTTQQEGRIYLLTPSVNLYYKNSFNVQGGLMANLSRTYGQKIKKAFPFITTSIDVLRLSNPNNPTSLKFFGSFAQTENFADYSTSLTDYTSFYSYPGGVFGSGTSIPQFSAPDRSYWIWQTGTRLGILNNQLSVNYQFEQRDFTTEVYVPVPGGTNINYRILYPDLTSSSHHIGINATVLNKNSLYWLTGINATSIKSKSKEVIDFYDSHTITGDFNSDKTSWTGGWVNRFSWKKFSAGVDLVYYFNPDQIPFIPGNSKINAVSLSNVYVGYQLNLKGTNGLELYADCRNLAQDKDFKITGTRKYYGLGVKTNL